jgi:proteasome lid subunit RPN8/RPN11
MKVVSSEKAWQGFLRRAKSHYPKEYVEALWGAETVDSFRVVEFRKMKLDVTTSGTIDYSDEEATRQRVLAKEEHLNFLGTIHTHPRKDSDTSPSQHDHVEAVKDGERIMGVVYIFQRSSKRFCIRVDWWFPQTPLDFVLLED